MTGKLDGNSTLTLWSGHCLLRRLKVPAPATQESQMAFLPPAPYPDSAYLREDSIKWALQKAAAVPGGG